MVDSTEKAQADALKIRIERYEEADKLPKFKFWDYVEVVSWFYKWMKWHIYKEWNLMVDPKAIPNTIYQEWLIATSYNVLFDLEDDKKELREIEARDIVFAIEDKEKAIAENVEEIKKL